MTGTDPRSGNALPKLNAQVFFLKYFFGVPHLATFIFVIFVHVIASIAYIHPVYGAGFQTHDLLIRSPLPLPLDHGSCLNVQVYTCYKKNLYRKILWEPLNVIMVNVINFLRSPKPIWLFHSEPTKESVRLLLSLG